MPRCDFSAEIQRRSGINMTDLVEFGWSDQFALLLFEGDSYEPARVVAEHRSGYRVRTATAERSARISGRLRHLADRQAEFPVVGDWVVLQSPVDDGDATIHRVLPRKSSFSRKEAGVRTEQQVIAANVDTVWIVSSLDQDFSLRRIERYLTLAWESRANPVIVLTKSDLCDDVEQCRRDVESISIGTHVHVTSSLKGEGIKQLHAYLRHHATVALLGSSGVGKSSLINSLAKSELQQTRAVRSDGKGRHTTIHRQLIQLPGGGLIIDTPGMRELQLWDGQDGLADTFAEIDKLATACRFSDCRHAGEPGCAVRDAIELGELTEDRLQSFQKLQRELAHLERKQDALAQRTEKRRMKSIMKSLRHHPKYKR